MATNSKQLKPLDIPFKEFMPGQVIQSVQFNDDMRDIEDTVNELVNEHNIVSEELSNHVDNLDNPHQVDAHQTGTYNTTEIDEFFQDVRGGNLDDNAITNRVLDDECVETRNYKDNSITTSKLDFAVGSQIDISQNMSIADRYTKSETDELIRSKVGEGTYSKDELDTKFEQVQAGQILDKSISINQLKDDVGRRLDISNNPDILNKYTRDEVDLLIQNNALPRDWGSILEEDNNTTVIPTKEITLPVANHMKVNTCTVSESSILDVDILENVDARGEFNSVGERLNSFDSQIKEIENIGNPTDEQVSNAINQAIADGKITSGNGWSTTAITLFETLISKLAFTDIVTGKSLATSLINELKSPTSNGGSSGGGSSETPSVKTYTITYSLGEATSSNNITSIEENTSYTTILSNPNNIYISSVTVLMNGENITDTVYTADTKTITIERVTGNLIITVITKSFDNLINASNCTDGETMPNGAIVTPGTHLVTDYIEVKPSTDYYCNITRYIDDTNSDWGQGIYYYAEDKTYKAFTQITTNQPFNTMNSFFISDTTYFVRIKFHVNYRDVVYFGESGVNQ